MAVRDQLLATIEAIYAAGLDPDRWEGALALVAETVGGVGCSLEAIDRRTMRHRHFRAHGLPSTLEIDYLAQYASVNPRWSLVVHQKAGDLGWDYRILAEEEMEKSPFYEDFLARVDFRYFAYGMLTATAEEFSGIAIHRTRAQGHVEGPEIERLRELVPHVRQAFDLSRRVAEAGAIAQSLEQTVDWLADGVALVLRDGRIAYANRAFRIIADQQDGILVQAERIGFAGAAAKRSFDLALARVGCLRAGEAVAVATVDFAAPRPSEAPSYIVSVRPILDHESYGTQAAAMVLIHDPLDRRSTATMVLRDAFGLTEAEAGLAHALQSGCSASDYARETGLSLNTVYTHLKRIKEKTGATRMAALVSRLGDLRSPVRDQ